MRALVLPALLAVGCVSESRVVGSVEGVAPAPAADPGSPAAGRPRDPEPPSEGAPDPDPGPVVDTGGPTDPDIGPTPPPAAVAIPAQTFEMGCTAGQDGCDPDEWPHEVTLTRAYEVTATEITQGWFVEVMGWNPSAHPSCGSDCPVDSVMRGEAMAMANAWSRRDGLPECYACVATTACDPPRGEPSACLGWRLPTEAEWEAAARCGTDLRYAGSDDVDAVAWTGERVGRAPHPVAQLAPNACGLYDASGNVWEWTSDEYGDYRDLDGVDPYPWWDGSSPVFRGGSSVAGPERARVSYRHYGRPFEAWEDVGFRLVRTLP